MVRSAESADSDVSGLVPNRACRSCVQIKVKCIPLQHSQLNICQRCHRLAKECTTPAPAMRKQRSQRTKVTQLEERINQLTALLDPAQSVSASSSQPQQHIPSPPTTCNTQPELGSNARTTFQQAIPFPEDGNVANDCIGDWSADAQPIARSGSPSMFVPHAPGRKDGSMLLKETFCPIHLEEEFENRLFADFRAKMLPHYPFAVIDPRVKAEVFKEKRPFAYWACVLVGSYRYRSLYQTLNDEMMKALGYRMLFAGSKSIDLLQGIMFMLGWSHNISHYSPQVINLLHLAQALLVDMGIAKPVRMADKIRIASDTTAMIHGTETIGSNVNTDEKRCLLGVYVFTSKVALAFNRLDPMRYSQHMDDFCKDLTAAAEHESDLLLVELVQLHRIFGKYLHVDSGPALSSRALRNVFQDEIHRYRHSLPLSLKDNRTIEVEILSNSVSLLEPCYTLEDYDQIDRLNALHICADHGSRLIDIVTGFPSESAVNLPYYFTISLIEVLVVLTRLSLFKAASWDTQYARRTVNVELMLERLQNMYERLSQWEASTYPNYTPWRFAIYAKKSQHIKNWFTVKAAADEADEAPPDPFNETMFGNFDDPMWHDLMGNWPEF